ncbi:DUF4328 domain-containing protein [Actinocrispum sp. NPDC049592]|uniref:DUF4328 domain-containing protein n=1 Tax=Actinocrispum sp. NPDC049592 TaxID=3154835 RepID=UPI00342A423D
MTEQHAALGDSYFNGIGTYRSTSVIAKVATAGIVLSCAVDAITTGIKWTQYNTITDYLAGTAHEADLIAADDLASTWTWPFLGIWLAAGILFLIWWYQTYQNATWLAGADSQRLSSGWAIGAWFCPIVNLWFPDQMVTDVWRASSPRRTAGTAMIHVWWVTYLVGNLLTFYASRVSTPASREPAAYETIFHRVAVIDTVATALTLTAGVLITVIITQLTRWQNTPRDREA